MKFLKTKVFYAFIIGAALTAAPFLFWPSADFHIDIPAAKSETCSQRDTGYEAALRGVVERQPNNFIAINDLISYLVIQSKRQPSDALTAEIFSFIQRSKKILNSTTDNKAVYLAESFILSYQHQFKEAELVLLSLLKDNPKNRTVLHALAWNALARKNAVEASQYLAELNTNPTIETYLLFAKLMYLQSRTNEFIFYINKIFQIEGVETCFESNEARLLLARFGLNTQNRRLANRSLSSAELINPDDPRLFYLKVRLLTEQKKYQKAIAVLETGLKKQPNPKYLVEMAKVEILRDRQNEAQPYLDQALLALEEDVKKSTGHRLELAEALVLKNTKESLESAILFLQEELKARDTNEVRYWLSVAHALRSNPLYGLNHLQPFLHQEFSSDLPAVFTHLKKLKKLENLFPPQEISSALSAEMKLLKTSFKE